MNKISADQIKKSPTAVPRDAGRTGVRPERIPMIVDDRGEKEWGSGSHSRAAEDCIRQPSKLMAVADCGGGRKDVSNIEAEGGGVLGGVIGKRLADSEGESGGEHLLLHAGQSWFDDSH